MRQVFSSQRIETVEGVAKLLTDAGIAVHISNGRSYQSKRSGQFSYTEPVKAQLQPAVWVRHAEDQPRARTAAAGRPAGDHAPWPGAYVDLPQRTGHTCRAAALLGLADPPGAAGAHRAGRRHHVDAAPGASSCRSDPRTGAAGAGAGRRSARGRPHLHPVRHRRLTARPWDPVTSVVPTRQGHQPTR